MSNLSELLPAGGAGKNVSFVASGTLPSGQAVALKTDGTVETISGVSQSVTAASTFSSTDARAGVDSAVYDTASNRVVIAYRDQGNGSYGTAVVGTVSGSSITFGSPVVFNSGVTYSVTAAYDSSSNKTVIAFQNQSNNYGIAYVGTVSGTSISFGTSVTFNTSTSDVGICYDVASNKTVISYRYIGIHSNHGAALVGTVSGTSISFGSEVVFNAADVTDTTPVYDSINQKSVIVYRDNGNASYGTAIVGTVSGTSISFGTEAVFNSTTTADPRPVYDSVNQKVVISYLNHGNSSYGTTVVGTVSGTGISYGTPVVVNSNSTSRLASTYNTAAGGVVVAYRDGSNVAKVITGNVSGTSISFGSAVVFDTATDVTYVTATYDPDIGKSIIVYETSNRGETVLYTSPSSNNTSFIGMADAAIADTAAGSVTIKGGLAKSVSNVSVAVPATVPDGNAVYFSTGRGRYSNVQWDPSDSTKFVVAWADGSTTPTYQGYAAVGSVSGNTITYGTPVQFDSLALSDMDTNSIAFDPNQSGRFVIFYSGGGGQGSRAIAGTRSGTSLSFGTSVQVFTSTAVQPSIEFDPNTSGQFLMNWGDGANNLRVGTLSGTTITLGTLVSISASYNQPNLVADPNTAGKYLIVYQDGADSDHGYVAVVTVTGTTPSMATPVKFLSAACVQPKIVYDSGVADAFVIVFVDGSNSLQASAIAGVVSGTTVSFGTAIIFNSNANSQLTTIISADPNKTGSFIAVADVSTIGEATFLTRSGTNTITAGATHILYNAAKVKGAIAFNPSASKSGQFVYVTEDRSASPYKAISVLGQGDYSSSVIVPGTDYYLQFDGTISPTSTSPAVKLGKALSTTSINLEFNT